MRRPIKQLGVIKFNVGERVFIKTPQIEGWATIMFIAQKEMYPLQIELDDPDDDGHKIYRVAYYEIIKDKQPEQPQRFVARASKQRNGYRIGDEFIIGPSTHDPYYNVYLKDRPNNGPIGSYITNFFEKIRPHIEETPKTAQNEPEKETSTKVLAEPENIENEAQSEPQIKITGICFKQPKQKEKKKADKKKKEAAKPTYEQLTLF